MFVSLLYLRSRNCNSFIGDKSMSEVRRLFAMSIVLNMLREENKNVGEIDSIMFLANIKCCIFPHSSVDGREQRALSLRSS